jgi:OmpA family protein
MKRTTSIAAGIVLVALGQAAVVQAQAPIVYPAKGQSAQKQQQDEGACHTWSKNNTGIDPAALAAAPPPPPPGPAVGGGERVAGALRGAVGGAAIGAIAGDTGKGAGIGAVAGTMAGGHRARQNQAAQQQQAQSQKQQQINTYYRAFGACMEGRGYTIK